MRYSSRMGMRWRGPVGSAFGMTLAVLAILEVVGPAGGQDVGPRIGTEVILESPETEVKVGPEVVATGRPHRLFTVKRVRGDWLWLVAGDVRGWVKQDEVVPFDVALEECNSAIETSHEAGWAYFRRGNLWIDKQDWPRAVADFDEALKISPTDQVIWRNRGLAYGQLKDYGRAIADYSEAIRLAPGYGWAYESRGRAFTEVGDYDRAMADFSEAFRLDPDDALALQGRGHVWVLRGNDEGAIADLTEALRLKPNFARAYSDRGIAFLNRKAYDTALADFTMALRYDPNDADAYEGRAAIWATCPDPRYRDGPRAVAAATRAVQLHGGNCPNCLDTLAAAQAEAGDFRAAVASENKALQILPAGDTNTASFRTRLALYQVKKPYHEGSDAATATNPIASTPSPRPTGAR